MTHCKICGEEGVGRDGTEGLTRVIRFWSPDDGWVVGRLCRFCESEAERRPMPDDFAYDRRGDFAADEDDAISEIYG